MNLEEVVCSSCCLQVIVLQPTNSFEKREGEGGEAGERVRVVRIGCERVRRGRVAREGRAEGESVRVVARGCG